MRCVTSRNVPKREGFLDWDENVELGVIMEINIFLFCMIMNILRPLLQHLNLP